MTAKQMTIWDVVLGNGTSHRVVADHYVVSTKMYGGNLTFYRGNQAVAVYNGWLAFNVHESTGQSS